MVSTNLSGDGYIKTSRLYKKVNDIMWKFDLSTMNEQSNIQNIMEHKKVDMNGMDCGEQIQNQRKVSVTVQLSDSHEYEGGDLEFNIGQHK